jgi:hypothetical protein
MKVRTPVGRAENMGTNLTLSSSGACAVAASPTAVKPPMRALAIIACLVAMARYSAALAIKNWYCNSAIGSMVRPRLFGFAYAGMGEKSNAGAFRAGKRAAQAHAGRIGPDATSTPIADTLTKP